MLVGQVVREYAFAFRLPWSTLEVAWEHDVAFFVIMQ